MRERLVRRRLKFSSRWELRLPTTNFHIPDLSGSPGPVFLCPGCAGPQKTWGLRLGACARVRVRARIEHPCGAGVPPALLRHRWNRAGEPPAPQSLPGGGWEAPKGRQKYVMTTAWCRTSRATPGSAGRHPADPNVGPSEETALKCKKDYRADTRVSRVPHRCRRGWCRCGRDQ